MEILLEMAVPEVAQHIMFDLFFHDKNFTFVFRIKEMKALFSYFHGPWRTKF